MSRIACTSRRCECVDRDHRYRLAIGQGHGTAEAWTGDLTRGFRGSVENEGEPLFAFDPDTDVSHRVYIGQNIAGASPDGWFCALGDRGAKASAGEGATSPQKKYERAMLPAHDIWYKLNYLKKKNINMLHN